MTENKPIMIDLACNICPDKKRCDEQRKRKDNIINSILDDIKDTAIAYNCNLKDKIEILKQNLPIITRCDIVLEKQLARKTQECENWKETARQYAKNEEYYRNQVDKLKAEKQQAEQKLKRIRDIASKSYFTKLELKDCIECDASLAKILQIIDEVE